MLQLKRNKLTCAQGMNEDAVIESLTDRKVRDANQTFLYWQVSWIRPKDVHILSAGSEVFVRDERFQMFRKTEIAFSGELLDY